MGESPPRRPATGLHQAHCARITSDRQAMTLHWSTRAILPSRVHAGDSTSRVDRRRGHGEWMGAQGHEIVPAASRKSNRAKPGFESQPTQFRLGENRWMLPFHRCQLWIGVLTTVAGSGVAMGDLEEDAAPSKQTLRLYDRNRLTRLTNLLEQAFFWDGTIHGCPDHKIPCGPKGPTA